MSDTTHDNSLDNNNGNNNVNIDLKTSKPVAGMYRDWFLEYASYVILDRAVPYIEDGLKPVQRRILHAMKEMDDGRFNKVANIIGQTMQYHPHGDAAIGDALVNLGQKNLLIETQGNWGNVLTGDRAAAPRYIEARLSKFAYEVVFNPQTTKWQLAYDGRKKEPVTLPVKFPMVLAQGVEGIAVGLSTRILPHNFNELIDASIAELMGKDFEIYPDFQGGGMIDVSNYNKGERGGRIRSRATIQKIDKKTLRITDLPFYVNTGNLIESIVKANEKGKIKIKKIDDNTSKNVDIIIHLAVGISPDKTIDALYAFTDCEVSISPNCCIIIEDKPFFTNIKDVLKLSTKNTVRLLKTELEIRKDELEEKWHFSSLEKIFIENRIYRDIEECETWEAVIVAIDTGLEPFKKLLKREVTEEDIVRLTEIKIKRISKFDSFKADELIKNIETDLEEVKNHLANLVDFAIMYFKNLKKKYGKDHERKTQIRVFDTIDASIVAAPNQKLYANFSDGFIGTSLKKDEFVCECSDIDDIIIFREDGGMMVTKVSEKTFVGKNIIYAGIFNKNDERMVYHMIYRKGAKGPNMVKRFQVSGVTRDKEYSLAKNTPGSKVLYFTTNPNGETETVEIQLRPRLKLRKLTFNYDFSELAIKNRSAAGNILCKQDIKKIVRKDTGKSTFGGLDLWFDNKFQRLNTDEKGEYLGKFDGEDRVLSLYNNGIYELTNYELTNRYDVKGELLEIHKLTPETVIAAIYYEGKSKQYYLKRFKIETTSTEKDYSFISENKNSKLIFATAMHDPEVEISFNKKGKIIKKIVKLAEAIDIKGWKAIGNKVGDDQVKSVKLISGVRLPIIEKVEPETEKLTESTVKNEEIEKANPQEAPAKPKSTPQQGTLSLFDDED